MNEVTVSSTIEERRRMALQISRKSLASKGSATTLAYEKKKEEVNRQLEEIPEHEREYVLEETNEEIKQMVDSISQFLTDHHSYELKASMFDMNIRETIRPIISSYIKREQKVITGYDEEELTTLMLNEICGLGPIDEIVQREGILNEIWVNGLNPVTKKVDIWYEKNGVIYRETKAAFRDREHAYDVAKKIARNGAQPIGTEMPLANVRYPEGRVNIVQEPVATGGGGPFISFRMFPKDTLLPDDFVKSKAMSKEMKEFTQIAVRYGANGLFTGGTGSGKTTLMTACIDFIPTGPRILLMEDTEEMRIRHKYPDKHIITEECKFNYDDETRNFNLAYLTRNALRQKPDYMIYGEVRDSAAYDMLNGGNTGHRVWSTLHSRSASRAVQRLINMVLEHGSKMNTDAIGKWISQSIDLIYFQKKYDDNVRRVKEIIQLVDFKDGEPVFRTIFKFFIEGKDDDGKFIGRHYRVGTITKEFAEHLVDNGAPIEVVKEFLKKPEQPPKRDLYEEFEIEDDNEEEKGEATI